MKGPQKSRNRSIDRPFRIFVAVAHSILVIAYHLIKRREPYSELGADYFLERQQKNAYQRGLVHQLERMDYDVKLEPKSAA